MFIPIQDANALEHIRFQYVTVGLILANAIVYFLTSIGVEDAFNAATIYGLGYIPAVVHNTATLDPADVFVPANFTYLTYSFMHADLFHLGGNMLFLWVFGDNVEDALGHVRFLLFYLGCAAAGAFVHGIILPDSQFPLIGASGAVAGCIAAYLMLHPHVKVWVLALMRIPLRIPAWIPLLLWIAIQFIMLANSSADQVSWPAHVGGILAGAVLLVLLKRRGVPLFDRGLIPGTDQPLATIAPPAQTEPPAPSKWGRPD